MAKINRVTNQTLSPIVLDNGTVMAASGTPGSIRDEVSLSESDRRRYVESGMLTVTAAPEEEAGKDAHAHKADDSGSKPISKITDRRDAKEKN